MQSVKAKRTPKKRAANTRLSPKALRRLANRLVATEHPVAVAHLKNALERGFYGDPEHA
jgi:hypothetical protein